MRLLEREQDEFILSTVDFMMKVDKNFRKEIHSHARFLYHEYQDELKQKKSSICTLLNLEERHEHFII